MTNFENGTYSLLRVPRILELNISGVYVNKDGPHQKEIEALKDKGWNKVLTQKLKARSHGDSTLSVGIISAKHFESREKLDTLYSKEWEWSEPAFPDKPITTIGQISFQEALKDHLNFTISCNMDYYLANLEEMEKDLGRKLDNLDLNNKDLMGKLENELFLNQSIKIFGDENDEEEKVKSTVIFRDFRVLFFDGNDKFATARRGDRYLIFLYQYV